MTDLPTKTDPPERKFLAFLYPEIKDLAKHFLTLVSGVLVFSVVVTAWLLWIAAVILVGFGVFVNFVVAAQALRHHGRDIRRLVWLTYVAMDAGGFFFVAGLLALAI